MVFAPYKGFLGSERQNLFMKIFSFIHSLYLSISLLKFIITYVALADTNLIESSDPSRINWLLQASLQNLNACDSCVLFFISLISKAKLGIQY